MVNRFPKEAETVEQRKRERKKKRGQGGRERLVFSDLTGSMKNAKYISYQNPRKLKVVNFLGLETYGKCYGRQTHTKAMMSDFYADQRHKMIHSLENSPPEYAPLSQRQFEELKSRKSTYVPKQMPTTMQRATWVWEKN